MAGAFHAPADPAVVTTVLGSCVAVCLWDRGRGLGGMNHYVLPRSADGEPGLRYGETAIDRLIQAMAEHGCTSRTLEAKIFGGAAVLCVADPERSVGTRNVDLARERLAHHGIPIAAQRTGGISGLWVRFWTRTGEVVIRPLSSPGDADLRTENLPPTFRLGRR
jgi:chemotaxis protein CheD